MSAEAGKAMSLFLRHLTPRQKVEWDCLGYIEIKGQKTPLHYRLWKDDWRNVEAGFYWCGRFRSLGTFCVSGLTSPSTIHRLGTGYPSIYIEPHFMERGDELLAFKLVIEADEIYFIRQANARTLKLFLTMACFGLWLSRRQTS